MAKKRKTEGIYKIQMAFNNNDMLIYDKYRRYMLQGPVTDEIKDILAGEMKIYVNGYVMPGGILQVTSRVPEQDW
jgi:hypothetical protein